MNKEETVVAVISPQTAEGESELSIQISDIERRAARLVVTDDNQYEEAGALGVSLKNMIAEVEAFFAPMKKSAHDAHKMVCDRERNMLAPLKKAEEILKTSMGTYVQKKNRERQEAEEVEKRKAREEVEKNLEAAIAAERSGDDDAAYSALITAQLAENAANTIPSKDNIPSAKGVSHQIDWEITGIEIDKVPDSISGVVIRPVDKSAILKLIRDSNGKVHIDGVTYRETSKISFRRK